MDQLALAPCTLWQLSLSGLPQRVANVPGITCDDMQRLPPVTSNHMSSAASCRPRPAPAHTPSALPALVHAPLTLSPHPDTRPALCRAKRKRAAEEKNTKMRSPNFLVSRNRLNVRNIPLGMSEGQLRSMFVAAVRERATKEVPRVLSVRPGVVG